MTLRYFFTTFLLLLLPLSVLGRDVVVPIPASVDIDEAGRSLRKAINAYEASLIDERPINWTRVTLFSGESTRLGPNEHLLLLSPEGRNVRVLLIDESGPTTVTLTSGRETTVGSLKLILLTASTSGRSAEILMKSDAASSLLLDDPIQQSRVRIEGSDSPKQIVVRAADGKVLDFSREFLRQFNQGATAEQSAAIARDRFPPVISAARRDYTDPVNFAMGNDLDMPFAAGVTFTLVRADSETLNQLSSELRYDSAGNNPSNPRVQGRTGPQGGEVILGNPGDRFRARLRILEREGRANVDGETFVRVPFDSETIFELDGGGNSLSAIVSAQLRGRDVVNLRIDNVQGDRDLWGSLRTSAQMRDGQTVMLARNSSTRTETSESQVPILGDIPFIGPIFGSSSRRVTGSDYAIYATLALE